MSKIDADGLTFGDEVQEVFYAVAVSAESTQNDVYTRDISRVLALGGRADEDFCTVVGTNIRHISDYPSAPATSVQPSGTW